MRARVGLPARHPRAFQPLDRRRCSSPHPARCDHHSARGNRRKGAYHSDPRGGSARAAETRLPSNHRIPGSRGRATNGVGAERLHKAVIHGEERLALRWVDTRRSPENDCSNLTWTGAPSLDHQCLLDGRIDTTGPILMAQRFVHSFRRPMMSSPRAGALVNDRRQRWIAALASERNILCESPRSCSCSTATQDQEAFLSCNRGHRRSR